MFYSKDSASKSPERVVNFQSRFNCSNNTDLLHLRLRLQQSKWFIYYLVCVVYITVMMKSPHSKIDVGETNKSNFEWYAIIPV